MTTNVTTQTHDVINTRDVRRVSEGANQERRLSFLEGEIVTSSNDVTSQSGSGVTSQARIDAAEAAVRRSNNATVRRNNIDLPQAAPRLSINKF